jgi:hypothetical protein
MYHNENVGMGAEHGGFADLQIDRLFFFASIKKKGGLP